jgi:ATP citrate (pro-S)-lyase
MSAKAIREFDGKHLLNYWIQQENPSATFLPPAHLLSLKFDLGLLEVSKKAFDDHVKTILNASEKSHAWLKTTQLVCKPDQLIKRRGKNGLLGINLDWAGVKKWIAERAGTVIHVCRFNCVHPSEIVLRMIRL